MCFSGAVKKLFYDAFDVSERICLMGQSHINKRHNALHTLCDSNCIAMETTTKRKEKSKRV